MIYAVSRKTKQHSVVINPYAIAFHNPEVYYVSADNDGWIEWEGGECPLPDDCVVETIDKNERRVGERYDVARKASEIDWRKHSCSYEIVAYRPILNAEEKKMKREWDGEGLPPVGCECVYVGSKDRTGLITHHTKSGFAAVIEYENGGYDIGGKRDFSPLRTERDRWIELACKEVDQRAGDYNEDVSCSAAMRMTIEAIYDAGLAKLLNEGETE